MQVVQLKLFSLNDYLGLSTHPKVGKAIAHAAEAVGTGIARIYRGWLQTTSLSDLDIDEPRQL